MSDENTDDYEAVCAKCGCTFICHDGTLLEKTPDGNAIQAYCDACGSALPLTREQVLSASDEQLNEWAARRVMEWTPIGCDRAWRTGGYARYIYEPSARLGDAFELVEKLRGKYWLDAHSPFIEGLPWFAGFTPLGITGWNGRPDFEGSADSLPRALTIAAVLTTLETQT